MSDDKADDQRGDAQGAPEEHPMQGAPDAAAQPPAPDAAAAAQPGAPDAPPPYPTYPRQQPPQYQQPQQPYAQQPPHPGYPQANQPHPGYPQANQPHQPHPGYPQSTGQGPQGPQPPRKRLGTGALVGIILGAVALVLVIVIVIAVVLVNQFAGARGGDPGAGGSGGAAGDSPSVVVTDYLTALSEGDAETALGLLSDEPEDDTLLTDEVLAASAELGAITDVTVLNEVVDSGSAIVTTSYELGGASVDTEFSLLDYDDDGVWEINGGLGYLPLGQFDGLDVTVNGQPAEGDELQVFPGTYELATDLPNFTIAGTSTVVITDPYSSADLSDTTPALSEAGLAQFRSLVRAAVDACVASTSLVAGCGLDLQPVLDDGTQLTDGTITRTLPADTITTLDSLEATLSYDNPTLAQGDYIGSIDVEAPCTQNGQTGVCSLLFGPSLGSPSVDMAAENPTVLWD